MGSISLKTNNICPICQRRISNLTDHHLVPVHKPGKREERAKLCSDCHSQIHMLFSNQELKKEYNTTKSIKNSKRMQAYLKFIENRNSENKLSFKESNRRKKKWRTII